MKKHRLQGVKNGPDGQVSGPLAELPAVSALGPSRVVTALLVVVIAGVTVAVFWPTLHNQFLNWDDDRNFLSNESFRGVGLEQARWAWSTYHLGVWQPLSWLLLGLQYRIGELDPRIYHVASLTLHVLNAVVFYLLIAKIVRRAARNAAGASANVLRVCAAAAAILFAIHPLRVEAVAWVSCQPYLPAALFYMLSVLAYLHGWRGDEPHSPRLPWLAAAFVLFLAAVMSKAVAVSLPVVLLALDVYPLSRWGSQAGWFGRAAVRVWAEKLPFIAVAIAVSFWAAAAKDFNESRVPFSFAAMDARLAQSAYGLVFYLYKTIAPAGLIPYYDLPDGLSLYTWRYGLCAGGMLAVTVFLFLLRRRYPAALAAWAVYVAILLPNLGVVQISRQLATDRYSYIAIMPIMILLAGGGVAISRYLGCKRSPRRVAAAIGVAAIGLALGVLSRRQVAIWHDSAALWKATLAVDPRCAVAECNLGVALLENREYSEASRHLSRAIDLQEGFAFAFANLGVLYDQAGYHEDAVVCYEKALTMGTDLGKPDLAKVHAGLGAAYAALRRDDLAWKHTRMAEQLGFKGAQRMIEYLRHFSTEPKAKD